MLDSLLPLQEVVVLRRHSATSGGTSGSRSCTASGTSSSVWPATSWSCSSPTSTRPTTPATRSSSSRRAAKLSTGPGRRPSSTGPCPTSSSGSPTSRSTPRTRSAKEGTMSQSSLPSRSRSRSSSLTSSRLINLRFVKEMLWLCLVDFKSECSKDFFPSQAALLGHF